MWVQAAPLVILPRTSETDQTAPHYNVRVPLTAGARLGSYEVVSPIGAGGMGDVYRARDTTLKRDVALKILPDAFTLDPDRVARFAREAEVLASLNHPNIAAIYGLEQSSGVQALVLELVEGPTLADRLADGRVPVAEALAVARQIAEALEAAHEHGVVHRDLKPANIKVRSDGTVKVLDFGLAKPLEPPSNAGELTQSMSGLSPAPTRAGVMLGTPAYMSPEQARGRAVDRRTDIWAFGCVLYEMLTGARPFRGETLTDTVAAIITSEPDWTALPAGTPGRVRSLVARCLRKDPAERLRDIADARFQIEEALTDPGGAAAIGASGRRAGRAWAPWIAAALFLGTTLLLATRPSTSSPSRESIVFPVFPPDKGEFSARVNTTFNIPSFAVSPDGRNLVFSAETSEGRPMLYLRSFDRTDARPLAGTEDAQDVCWSPDGRWIGFFAAGALRKVPAVGGTVQVINQASNDIRGMTWGARDTILLGSGAEGIVSMNAAGGAITPVTVVDTSLHENTHRNPSFLPDGVHFLYSVIGDGDQSGVYLGSVDGKTKTRLLRILTSAVYASPGYLLYVDGDRLMAQPFDAGQLDLTGQPLFVAEHVGRSSSFMSGVSAALTTTIAYAQPIAKAGRLTWADRGGKTLNAAPTPEGDYTDFRLSPDETRLAASLADPKTSVVDIWITDLTRGSSARLGSGGAVTAAAVWSPDGSRVAFRSNRTGVIGLYERSASGGGSDRPIALDSLQKPLSGVFPTDWSPDGRQLMLVAPTSGTHDGLWLLPLGGAAKPVKLVAPLAEVIQGNFSPNGHLVAYASNESGRFEVYVETVPESDRKWPVSTNGGYEPRWRADGREIYYLSVDQKLMAVSVGEDPSFGVPRALFRMQAATGIAPYRTHYVPSRDGQRFLVDMTTDAPPQPITVVVDWTAALKK
jgi:serine/threonine protein kinase